MVTKIFATIFLIFYHFVLIKEETIRTNINGNKFQLHKHVFFRLTPNIMMTRQNMHSVG